MALPHSHSLPLVPPLRRVSRDPQDDPSTGGPLFGGNQDDELIPFQWGFFLLLPNTEDFYSPPSVLVKYARGLVNYALFIMLLK